MVLLEDITRHGPQMKNTAVGPYPEPREIVKCKDGTTLSVQASEFTYCTPRNNQGPYDTVEVGFPSVKPTREMLEYAEDRKKPTKTIYPYVPVEIVREFIDKHGGEVDRKERRKIYIDPEIKARGI